MVRTRALKTKILKAGFRHHGKPGHQCTGTSFSSAAFTLSLPPPLAAKNCGESGCGGEDHPKHSRCPHSRARRPCVGPAAGWQDLGAMFPAMADCRIDGKAGKGAKGMEGDFRGETACAFVHVPVLSCFFVLRAGGGGTNKGLVRDLPQGGTQGRVSSLQKGAAVSFFFFLLHCVSFPATHPSSPPIYLQLTLRFPSSALSFIDRPMLEHSLSLSFWFFLSHVSNQCFEYSLPGVWSRARKAMRDSSCKSHSNPVCNSSA
jgi:hypothetical protein